MLRLQVFLILIFNPAFALATSQSVSVIEKEHPVLEACREADEKRSDKEEAYQEACIGKLGYMCREMIETCQECVPTKEQACVLPKTGKSCPDLSQAKVQDDRQDLLDEVDNIERELQDVKQEIQDLKAEHQEDKLNQEIEKKDKERSLEEDFKSKKEEASLESDDAEEELRELLKEATRSRSKAREEVSKINRQTRKVKEELTTKCYRQAVDKLHRVWSARNKKMKKHVRKALHTEATQARMFNSYKKKDTAVYTHAYNKCKHQGEEQIKKELEEFTKDLKARQEEEKQLRRIDVQAAQKRLQEAFNSKQRAFAEYKKQHQEAQELYSKLQASKVRAFQEQLFLKQAFMQQLEQKKRSIHNRYRKLLSSANAEDFLGAITSMDAYDSSMEGVKEECLCADDRSKELKKIPAKTRNALVSKCNKIKKLEDKKIKRRARKSQSDK